MIKKFINFAKSKRQYLYTTVVEYGAFAVQLLVGILTARILGPEGKGELTAMLLWPILFSGILTGGVEHAVIVIGSKDKSNFNQLWKLCFYISLIIGFISSAIGYFTVPHLLANYSAHVVVLTQLYFLWTPIRLLSGFSLFLLQSKREIFFWNALRLLQVLILIALIGGYSLLGNLNLKNALIAYVFGDITTLLVSFFIIIKHYDFGKTITDRRVYKEVFNFSIKNALSGWLARANAQLDQAIISIFLTEKDLGLYRISVSGAGVVGLFPMGVQRLLLTQASGDQTLGQKKRLILKRYLFAIIFSGLPALLIIAFVKPIVAFLYGDEYLSAVPIISILLVGACLQSGKRMIQNGFRSMGMPGMTLYADIPGLIVGVILLIILLPVVGVIGAAIASLCTYFIAHFIMLWLLLKRI